MANEEQYVVEKILNTRIRRGVVQYLIKWTGCDEAQNTWEPEKNLKCDTLLQKFRQDKAAETKKRGQKRSTRSLPSDDQRKPDDNERDGAAEMVEKKDDEKLKTTSRAKNQPRKKVGKKSLDISLGRPDEGCTTESAVKVEKNEVDLKCDELLPGSDPEKAVQSMKRGRRTKLSLPSESNETITKKETAVKVESKEDEVQATKEPMRKRAKRSLDTSQGQPDESSVLVEKIEKKDMKRTRQIKPKGKVTKDTQPQASTVSNVTEGEGSKGFARGYVVESLVGITQEGNKFLFLVKWQGMDEMEMVPSAEVRKYVPEMMIDFYENRIIWRKKDQAGK